MRTLDFIMKIFDRPKIDILKLDIEFGEWKLFEYLYENPSFLNKINQIAIEV